MKELIPIEIIERKIYLIRGQKVMLDSDLAELYEVPTRRLNEQVKRNITRFPADFMFQLTDKEASELEIANCDLKFRGDSFVITLHHSLFIRIQADSPGRAIHGLLK